MFLMEAGVSDFQALSEPIRTILDRAEAEVLALNPWEERRLAYEIKGHKRGMYVLSYFKVDPLKVADIEHDCQLNEDILRALFIRHDKINEEQINSKTPAMSVPQVTESQEEEPAKADDLAKEAAPEEATPEEAAPEEAVVEAEVSEETEEVSE